MFRMNRRDGKTKKICVILALEFLIFVFMLARVLYRGVNEQSSTVQVPLSAMLSDRAILRDDGWYMDETCNEGSSESCEMLYGPYANLPHGSYEVTILYDATAEGLHEHAVHVESIQHGEHVIADQRINLYKNMHSVTVPFELIRSTNDVEFSVEYVGDGSLTIKGIEYRRTSAMECRQLIELLVLCILFDLVLFAKDGRKERKREIVWGVATVLVACAPLFIKGINLENGQDLEFHLLQIDGLYQGLKAGMFPVRIQPGWLAGYGYPLSVCYGDLFLYCPAVLRICGFSLVASYKIYIFLLTALTAYIAYFASCHIGKGDRTIALIGMVAYVLAPYRLLDIYLRSAVGEYTAIAFLPLVFVGLYDLYFGENQKKQGVLLIILGMTGILQSHVLTSLITCIFFAFFILILCKKTFTKSVFCSLLAAVMGTILLNLWLLLPMADYLLHMDMLITSLVSEEYGVVCATNPLTYLLPYRSIFAEDMQALPGYILLGGLFGWLIIGNKKDEAALTYGVLAMLGLFMASNLCPWEAICEIPIISSAFKPIQFAFRFMVAVQCFMLFLLCILLSDEKNGQKKAVFGSGIKRGVLILSAVISVCWMVGVTLGVAGKDNRIAPSGMAALDSRHCMVGQFMRTDCDRYALDGELHGNRVENLIETRKAPLLESFSVDFAGEHAYVEVPIINYKGYVATDQNQNSMSIEDGMEKTIRVMVPKDFSGEITVQWKTPVLWRTAECVSLLSLVVLFLLMKRKSIV